MSCKNTINEAIKVPMQRMNSTLISHASSIAQQGGQEQHDDQDRCQQSTRGSKGDGQANLTGALPEDGQLGRLAGPQLGRAVFQLMHQQPSSVDDAAQAVGHRQQKQADPGDRQRRTDRGLENGDQFRDAWTLHGLPGVAAA